MKNYSINVKDTTIVARTNNYKRIQEDLGHLKVADIRQSHVQKAINENANPPAMLGESCSSDVVW